VRQRFGRLLARVEHGEGDAILTPDFGALDGLTQADILADWIADIECAYEDALKKWVKELEAMGASSSPDPLHSIEYFAGHHGTFARLLNRHDARVSELLAANNAEVERRRTSERLLSIMRGTLLGIQEECDAGIRVDNLVLIANAVNAALKADAESGSPGDNLVTMATRAMAFPSEPVGEIQGEGEIPCGVEPDRDCGQCPCWTPVTAENGCGNG
jgi:hypothetical protein